MTTRGSTEDEAAAEDEAPAGGLAERTEALDGEANSDATAPNSDSDARAPNTDDEE